MGVGLRAKVDGLLRVVKEGEEAWKGGYAPKWMVSHASSPLREGGSLSRGSIHEPICPPDCQQIADVAQNPQE